MSYHMDFEEEANVREEDAVMEYEGGFRLVCDPKSLLYLFGMEVRPSQQATCAWASARTLHGWTHFVQQMPRRRRQHLELCQEIHAVKQQYPPPEMTLLYMFKTLCFQAVR